MYTRILRNFIAISLDRLTYKPGSYSDVNKILHLLDGPMVLLKININYV